MPTIFPIVEAIDKKWKAQLIINKVRINHKKDNPTHHKYLFITLIIEV